MELKTVFVIIGLVISAFLVASFGYVFNNNVGINENFVGTGMAISGNFPQDATIIGCSKGGVGNVNPFTRKSTLIIRYKYNQGASRDVENTFNVEDTCLKNNMASKSGRYLREYYCLGNYYFSTEVDCGSTRKGGCLNGACKKVPECKPASFCVEHEYAYAPSQTAPNKYKVNYAVRQGVDCQIKMVGSGMCRYECQNGACNAAPAPQCDTSWKCNPANNNERIKGGVVNGVCNPAASKQDCQYGCQNGVCNAVPASDISSPCPVGMNRNNWWTYSSFMEPDCSANRMSIINKTFDSNTGLCWNVSIACPTNTKCNKLQNTQSWGSYNLTLCTPGSLTPVTDSQCLSKSYCKSGDTKTIWAQAKDLLNGGMCVEYISWKCTRANSICTSSGNSAWCS